MSNSWGCRGKPRICKYYPMACVAFSSHSIDYSEITHLSSVTCKFWPAAFNLYILKSFPGLLQRISFVQERRRVQPLLAVQGHLATQPASKLVYFSRYPSNGELARRLPATKLATEYDGSVSNGFLYALETCLVNVELSKTFYLFECLRGTLVVLEGVGGFFFSFETVRYPDGSNRKSEDMESPCFYEFLREVLSPYRNLQDTCKEKSQYCGNKMWKTQLLQNRRKVSR